MESVSRTGPVHYRTAAVGGLNTSIARPGGHRRPEHGATEGKSRQAA